MEDGERSEMLHSTTGGKIMESGYSEPLAKCYLSGYSLDMASKKVLLSLLDQVEPTEDEAAEIAARPNRSPAGQPRGDAYLDTRWQMWANKERVIGFEAAVRCVGWPHGTEAVRSWMARVEMVVAALFPKQYAKVRAEVEKDYKARMRNRAPKEAKPTPVRELPHDFSEEPPLIPSQN